MPRKMHRTSGPGPAQLVIADDHDLARAGLCGLLDGEPGLAVVGEAATGREAIALCRRVQPDLALMDVNMPDLDGLAATAAIRQACPRTSIIVITMYESPDYFLRALKSGAAGYLLKGASKQEIVKAVRQVLKGESPLQPQMVAEMLQQLARETHGDDAEVPEPLTGREHDVLQLLAQGQTNRDIAKALFVSVTTVKTHVEHIIHKFGVADRTQAAVRAVELGLLTMPASPGEDNSGYPRVQRSRTISGVCSTSGPKAFGRTARVA